MKRGRSHIDQSRYPVFVTTTVTDFIPVFSHDSIAVACLQLFEKQRAAMGIATYAYVLMPHHLHTIIRAQSPDGVSKLIGAWKSLSARIILDSSPSNWQAAFAASARLFHEPGRKDHKVWMARFDDVALYSEDVYLTKLNYIHENPVRAGLASSADKYPYSSAHAFVTGKGDRFITLSNLTTGACMPVDAARSKERDQEIRSAQGLTRT